MTECEATPLTDSGHDGQVGSYIRICSQGHIRLGYACASCVGNGTVLCNECPGDAPALLIGVAVFAAMPLHAIHADLRGRLHAEPTSDPVDGHEIRAAGRPFRMQISRWLEVTDSWVGYGVCECGEASPLLHSNRARIVWHREHKGLVRAREAMTHA